MNTELKYPLEKFKPLVIESYRSKDYNGTTYKRRLRVSRYNAMLVDEVIGTRYGRQDEFRFVVVDAGDIEKVCKILGIEYKPVNTYFDINLQMCSFSEVPSLRN